MLFWVCVYAFEITKMRKKKNVKKYDFRRMYSKGRKLIALVERTR